MNDTTFQGDGKVAYVPVVVNTKHTPITNYDRLHEMSVEELAYFIAEPSVAPPPWCKEILCPHWYEEIVPCHECALDWLKQEVATNV